MAKKFEMENSDELLPIFKSELETLLAEFKIGLVKLGLKGIEDLNNKRVQNPNDFYNLRKIFSLIKLFAFNIITKTTEIVRFFLQS